MCDQGSTHHFGACAVVGLDDGQPEGCHPLHGAARLGDQPGTVCEPVLQQQDRDTPSQVTPGHQIEKSTPGLEGHWLCVWSVCETM